MIKEKRVVQQVISTCLFYAQAVDCTILPAISSIASEQTNATEGTEKQIKQLLDYLAMQNQVLCVKNDFECTLRCILFIRTQS